MTADHPMPPLARFPVVYDGAEHLVRGYLQRANILTFLPPRGYEAYDVLAVHPDPKLTRRAVRIQVKSRLATDSGIFHVKPAVFSAVDYFAFVIMNLGYHFHGAENSAGVGEHPSIFLVPASEVEKMARPGKSLRGHQVPFGQAVKKAWGQYLGNKGVARIAKELGIPEPIPERLRSRRVPLD